jgi:hypothetical protein
MKAGEVFTLHSEGTGAGEFADIQQPDMKGFDRATNYKANWKIAEDGDVFSSFLNRQPIRNAVFKCFKPLKAASKTNLIEEIINPVPLINSSINCQIDPYSVETFVTK